MNRRTLAKSLFALVFATLALALTSCGGSTKTVYRDRTVTSIAYRDATTTTSVPSRLRYADDTADAEVKADFYHFSARFPVFPDYEKIDFEWFKYAMPADANTTGGTRYYSSVYAALKGDKVIFCSGHSEHCTLNGTFSVEVYLDNEINRAYLAPSSIDTCVDATATGVKGQECWWDDEDNAQTYHDMTFTHNGKIFVVSYSGSVKLLPQAGYFGRSFGFTDV